MKSVLAHASRRGATIAALALLLSLAWVGGAVGATTRTHGAATTTYTVKAVLEKGTKLRLEGTVGSATDTVTCTSFSASATTTSTKSVNVSLPKPPTITGCTDSLSSGDTDTVTTNQKNGHWTLVQSTSGKSTYLTLTIPKAAATITSSSDPSCVITAAPTAAAPVKGSFVSSGTLAGTDTIKDAAVPVSGSGCTTSATAKLSATVVITSKK